MTHNYQRDYCAGKSGATETEQEAGNAPVIPRIKPELFRERKDLGICNRSAAFCHNNGYLSLANLCRRRCAERISPACSELKSRARGSPESFRGDTGRVSKAQQGTGVID